MLNSFLKERNKFDNQKLSYKMCCFLEALLDLLLLLCLSKHTMERDRAPAMNVQDEGE